MCPSLSTWVTTSYDPQSFPKFATLLSCHNPGTKRNASLERLQVFWRFRWLAAPAHRPCFDCLKCCPLAHTDGSYLQLPSGISVSGGVKQYVYQPFPYASHSSIRSAPSGNLQISHVWPGVGQANRGSTRCSSMGRCGERTVLRMP